MKDIVVAIIMGSNSDYPVMKEAEIILDKFNIKYESKVVSAHRTPQKMYEFALSAKEKYSVIIAAAGGAAHLPGMVASMCTLPVIGVPIKSKSLDGLDSLLSIAQMPPGIPVATMGINQAANAAIMATSIISTFNKDAQIALENYKLELIKKVEKMELK
ncbi:5-(carboxyamino)imidazole ribonucleotide mutase [Mycoplasma sp. P36-A1]|uniref:5-(carboxyamino)imidazole ribonucleotide mutase n=1 Tax=Mycoplasma sp. P36-A1 TaxID=3252900 RepID=UPI003C2DF92F